MKLRMLGHVALLLEIRESCIILTGKAERKRLLYKLGIDPRTALK
jgi:hypothetical protein